MHVFSLSSHTLQTLRYSSAWNYRWTKGNRKKTKFWSKWRSNC